MTTIAGKNIISCQLTVGLFDKTTGELVETIDSGRWAFPLRHIRFPEIIDGLTDVAIDTVHEWTPFVNIPEGLELTYRLEIVQ